MSLEKLKEVGKKLNELTVNRTFKDDKRNVLLTYEYLKQGILLCPESQKGLLGIKKGQYIIMKRNILTNHFEENPDEDYYYWVMYGKEVEKPKVEYGEGKIENPHFTVIMDWRDTVSVQTRRLKAIDLSIKGRCKIKGSRILADHWGRISWGVAREVAKLLGKKFKGSKKKWWGDEDDV